jgi:Asp-tRNA(Asn)/Glu-tRNA(Gln) amidotransferase A subunit family amidase
VRQAAATVAAGDRSPLSLVEESIGRVERAADLNAFTSLDERAPDRARSAPSGPLAGVPVALKDLIDHAGRTTTCGSSFYRNVAEADATVTARLEAAGAVIVGRTGLHEFAIGFTSENPWWGPVRNPWDLGFSPGGSSGGSAAAVAAGIVPAALGTDTGGSVRVPAALCGLVGLKPTHGRIPLTGVFPLVGAVDTVGPLTADIADAALLFSVLAGHDPADPWSVDRPPREDGAEVRLEDLTFGVPHPWVDRPLDDVVAAGFRTALDRLADAGAEVHDLPVPEIDPPGRLGWAIGPSMAAVHGQWLATGPERYGADVRRRVEAAMAVTPEEAAAGREWAAATRTGLDRALAAVDVVLTPTTAVHRKRIGVADVETPGGPEHHRRALSWFTAPVNHTGLPALAVPLESPGSPPPSLQIIGPAWSELRLFAVAAALETAGVIAPAQLPQPTDR